MAACVPARCVLRPEFVNLELPDQAAMILACRLADAQAFDLCSRKQAEQARWIKASEKSK